MLTNRSGPLGIVNSVKKLIAIGSILIAAASAGGCTVAAVKAMDGGDKAISKLAQADCELVRVFHGKEICVEKVAQATALLSGQPVYCYRRLGSVDCYIERDPRDKPINREVTAKPVAQAPQVGGADEKLAAPIKNGPGR